MRKRWLRASLPGVLAGFMVGSLALGGCTRTGTQDAAQAVADPVMHRLLQHVPVDTPYAFIGMGGGGTRDFAAKIYAPLTPLMKQIADKLAGPDLQSQLGLSAEKFALVSAVLDEVKDKLSVDGMATLGLDVDARFAIYGLGLLPAMRVQLRDPAALRGALERIQAKSGTQFKTTKFGEIEYWPIPIDDYEVAIAIIDDQLVVGVAPTALRDRTFALLLGSELPARHLGDSDRFQQVLSEYGLAKISAGFVDARLIAEAFLGDGDALNRDSVAVLVPTVASTWPAVDDTCKQEIRSLVALAPRMVFGTEQIDGTGFTGKFVLELRPDLAQEVMAMRASVPGLDPEHIANAMFAMGGGFDVERLLTSLRGKATAIHASPYACPALFALNRAAGEASTGLSDVPQMLHKSRGFAIVAEDVKLSGLFPSEVRGYAMFATADTKGVLDLMRVAPPFTTATLTDDGTVTTLPDGTIPFINNFSYGAKADVGLVIAVGAGSKERVGELLSAPAQSDPPLLTATYDMSRMGALMEQAMGTLGTKPPEMQFLIDFYKSFGPVGYEMRAGERGIVMTSHMSVR